MVACVAEKGEYQDEYLVPENQKLLLKGSVCLNMDFTGCMLFLFLNFEVIALL